MKQFGLLNWSCSWLAVILVLAASDVSVQAQTSAAAPAKAPAPAAEVEAAARKKVRELYATDLQLAKGPAQISGLATKMAEAANDPKSDINSAFALSAETSELYASIGDVLSAFRLIDALALRVDVNPTFRKLELFKKLAKEKLSVPQKRVLAIVGLIRIDDLYRSESRRVFGSLVRWLKDFDLADDAMHEAYATAVEVWQRDRLPENPGAWLISIAQFKAINSLRRLLWLLASENY